MHNPPAWHVVFGLGLLAIPVACGLPTDGLASSDAGAGGDGPIEVSGIDAGADRGPLADGSVNDGPPDSPGADGSVDDGRPDSPGSGGLPCTPNDAAILGALSLASFTTAGAAQYNEYGDGFVTLTQAANNVAGAAWYPQELAVATAYDLTWTVREQPNDVAGSGFTFAVLTSSAAPSASFVGGTGDAMGLRDIGRAAKGYAVGLYLYGGIKLEILSMPGFKTLVSNTTTGAINDGTSYAVDVSWRAPSTLRATLHAPGGPLTVTSSDPSIAAAGAAWFGVTAATGPASNSRNELAGLTVSDACE
jgi:hypothetical protein